MTIEQAEKAIKEHDYAQTHKPGQDCHWDWKEITSNYWEARAFLEGVEVGKKL